MFVLNIDDEVFFRRGKINLIVGPTGAGKTSLLMALLGEMLYLPRGSGSFVSLPRDGGVAYAAQESWVQSDTIKVRRVVAWSSVCANSPVRIILYLGRRLTRCDITKVGSFLYGIMGRRH